MSISIVDRIEGDVKTEVEALVAKGEELIGHGKTLLETHLPAVVADVQRFENEPFVKSYLAANFSLPEHLVNVGLDFLSKLAAAWEGQSPAPAPLPASAEDAGPVGLDAQPDQPAA